MTTSNNPLLAIGATRLSQSGGVRDEMMKILAILSALFLVVGCSRQSAFDDVKTYIAATPQSHVDAEHLAGIMYRVCRGDGFVVFLKHKLTSDDPHDAVAAYVILSELVAHARLHPTPERKQLAEEIAPADIASEFSNVDVSSLTGNWVEWLSLTERIMNENLEQTNAAYRR